MVRKLKLRNIIKYKIHTIISKRVAIFHIGTNSIHLPFLLEKKNTFKVKSIKNNKKKSKIHRYLKHLINPVNKNCTFFVLVI